MRASYNLYATLNVSIKKKGFPSGIPFIVANEAAERFSFYGIKAILTVFLVTQFYNPGHVAALTQSANSASCAAVSLRAGARLRRSLLKPAKPDAL